MDYARRFLQGLYGGTPKNKNKKNEPPKNKKNEPITLRKLLNNNMTKHGKIHLDLSDRIQ